MSILTFIQSRSALRGTRRLYRLGTMSYWSWRSRRRQGRLGWSQLLFALRDWIDQVRQDGSLLAQLAFNAVSTGIVTMVLPLGLEAIAAVLNGHNVAWARGFDGHIAPERYESLVAAAVGAQATFLALFFTTVGVIAATAYANVPGEIRQLFVAERGSRLYIANVVRALIFGVAILSMRVIDHQPHVLTVLSLTVLTVFSVLSLAALGTGLFNFFDLSSLRLHCRGASVALLEVPLRAGPQLPERRFSRPHTSEQRKCYRSTDSSPICSPNGPAERHELP